MIIVAFILIAMLFVAGAKIVHLMLVSGMGATAACLYVFSTEFRKQRLLIFLDPWQDSLGKGWQIIQSLYAISSGGLFGVGLGQGVQKYMYISEPHNDFILATWAEETGLFGVLLIILFFGIFVWRGIIISMRARDRFRKTSSNWNNVYDWNTSPFKYSGCFFINACYWNIFTIL